MSLGLWLFFQQDWPPPSPPPRDANPGPQPQAYRAYRIARSSLAKLLPRKYPFVGSTATALFAKGLAIASGKSAMAGAAPLFYVGGPILGKFGPYTVLSNGNLTATSPSLPGIETNFATALSAGDQISGKRYAEFTFTNYLSGWSEAGFANSSFNLNVPHTDWLGFDSNSLAIVPFSTGSLQIIINGTQAALYTGYTITAPFVVQMAVDLTNQLLWVNVNNTSWNGVGSGANPATNTGGLNLTVSPGPLNAGPYYAGVTLAATTDNLTVNFGGSPFAFAPPSGFANWGDGSFGSTVSSGRAVLSGALPLLARGIANAVARISAGAYALTLSARGAMAAHGISRLSGVVPMLARGAASTIGRSAIAGVVPLLTRGVATAFGRSVVVNALFLLARGTSAAFARISAGSYALALSVRGRSIGTGRSALAGVLPLLARSAAAATGRAVVLPSIFLHAQGLAAATGRVAAGTYKLAFGAIGTAATSGRVSLTGGTKLLAHGVAAAYGRAIVNTASFIHLFAAGLATAVGRASPSGVLPLLARGAAKTIGLGTSVNVASLLARGTAATTGRVAAGAYALALTIRGVAASSGRSALAGIVPLLARGSAAAFVRKGFTAAAIIFISGLLPYRSYRISRGLFAKRLPSKYPFQFGFVGLFAHGAAAAFGRSANVIGTVPMLARGSAAATGRMAGAFAATLRARGSAAADSIASLIGAVPLFSRGVAAAFGKNAVINSVSLLTRGAAAAFGRSVTTGVLPLLARGAAEASGRSVVTAIAALFARGAAAAVGRGSFVNAIFLFARGVAAAYGGVADGSGAAPYFLALSTRGSAKAFGQSAISGTVRLFARGAASAFGRGAFFRGLIFVGLLPARAYRISRGLLAKRLPSKYPFQFLPVGLTGYTRHFRLRTLTFQRPKLYAIRSNLVLLFGRGTAEGSARVSLTGAAPLLTRGTAKAFGRSVITSIASLFTRATATAFGRSVLVNTVFLLARGSAATSGRMAGAFAATLHARGSAIARGLAPSIGVVPLLARGTAIAVGRVGFTAVNSVLLVARGAASAFGRIASGSYPLKLSARGAAKATAQSIATGVVSLFAFGVAQGFSTVIPALFTSLLARGTGMASGLSTNMAGLIKLSATTLSAASGRLIVNPLVASLKAFGTATTSDRTGPSYSLAMAARIRLSAKGFGALAAKVPLFASGMANAAGRSPVVARAQLFARGLGTIGAGSLKYLLTASGLAAAFGRVAALISRQPPTPFVFGQPFGQPILEEELDQGPSGPPAEGPEFTGDPALKIDLPQ